MDDAGDVKSSQSKMKGRAQEEEEDSDEEVWDSDDDDETIARIQRAHYAQAAAMNPRRRAAPRVRPMSQKRKMEAVKSFHDFTKKLKQDTGIKIRSLVGNNILDLSDFSSEDSESESDGLSEEEFVVNPNAVQDLNEENESYIDPETGDFVDSKKKLCELKQCEEMSSGEVVSELNQIEEPKTLSISDIINEGGLDLSKNVEIAEVEDSEWCSEKAEDLLGIKQEDSSQDYDITEKLKEMGEISVKPLNKKEEGLLEQEKKPENEEEKKANPNAINMRRNIREVMDEKNLDASTLTAQRQESERLARVQEQQRIIREVQRQIALNRQNKLHQKTLSLLQGGSSLLKKSVPGQKLNLPNTVLVKLPSGEVKKTTIKPGQLDIAKVPKASSSGSGQKPGKSDQKKEVVEIVDSSSGEESSSSSSDSDDCIMLSDSEVPPSPEAEDDPNNSGLHVNDTYNIPDEQGRVLINIGHPENEEDIFLAPQIARIIKPHQIGGVRFLFDNIIESVERFSTSTGFGCILAHSMGLGKTLQIVCFCDIFLRHTNSKTVLCIMPINTLQNWVAEFNMWLPLDASTSPLAAHGEVRPRNFPIYVLNDSHKTLQMRAKVVKDWTTTGGVLMIGYELYRLLSMKKDKKPRKKKKCEKSEKEKEDKKTNENINDDTQSSDITNLSKMSEESKPEKEDNEHLSKIDLEINNDLKKEDTQTDEEKKLLDEMYEALVRPGPDLVICDEGHRIKNSHSNISYALKQMRTKRRVVLTGYPLQNNLLEYWCMVDFVRPNYLGSKTEFCNMFERPIQNGQCIDSTPQDIRLMRYRAHVLHSLLVGFVQRRSHAVLQSTLPQKEEYVLLVRMTPLQRKLYDRFMNEVVRSTSVPNPLKAFAICCKIWNHPDVLYNFLRKRSEVNAAIEEDLDLEELGGVTKAGKAKNSKATPRRATKPRGSSKKPAATIPPNTTTGQVAQRPDNNTFGNTPYPNGPYGPPPPYRQDQPAGQQYPPYQNYQNPGYYPNQGYSNQNYDNNYYQQQQQNPPQPYDSNYQNQYPQNNPECPQGYNQNYWNNSNYYGNTGYYNNQPYPNNQPPPDYRGNPAEYNNSQQYPQGYSGNTDQPYPGNAMQPYSNNQENYGNQPRPTFQNYPGQTGYENFNANTSTGSYPTTSSNNVPPGAYPSNATTASYPNNTSGPYPNNTPPGSYPNNTPPGPYPNNTAPGPYPNNTAGPYPNNTPPGPYPNNTPSGSYPNNPPSQEYPNQSYPPPYTGNQTQFTPNSSTYNQYDNQGRNYQGYGNNMPPNQTENNVPNTIKTEANVPSNYLQDRKPDTNVQPPNASNFEASYNYPTNTFTDQTDNSAGYASYSGFPAHLKTEPPLGSAGSGSPLPSWPITEIKTEVDKLKAEEKTEIKSESDGEVKIEDLDTKKIVKDETNKSAIKESPLAQEAKSEQIKTNEKNAKINSTKTDKSESEEEAPKKRGPKPKPKDKKEKPKAKSKAKAKGRKDRKTSKEKNDVSESEESEKEEKVNREEELAMVKKAEEMTYDWATELLKDYVPGIIENSAKMELLFYILNESVKMGDRLLLFSQSLFTLNLIEDFLERNYIPGTNCLWERNKNYYRLDGSTHALEREKLINEFNANPHVHLFLVSTRAGSLGINLVGANRVIVFDASWNPCHDTQAVCRVYRYGQRKPCFVYRFVMDWCLEKKIYDRQINKQGMADRVVDECNPDAVLSMKEITNLCFDNDEKESEPTDLSEFKDKYIDVLMQGIITQHWKMLSKEPFQHESLLVDRKEKKLSSAEKRLAQRGYELEKKAALAPKPAAAYRTVRAADGSLVQRPVASVRPMQHGARWIPADVWRRQGMTAQEMTLPLDVVIPTNSAEKTNIVLKAGQRVMVLKSPKGIYMQLESGKIIAIKTSFKGLGKGGENKDSPVGKKVLGSRPASTPSIPGSLKNNSAITITSNRSSLKKMIARPPLMGQNRITRPVIPGQKIADIRNRLGEMRSLSMRGRSPMQTSRLIRPSLPGSLSITKIAKDGKKSENNNGDSNVLSKMDLETDEDTQVLDSDEEEPNREQSTTNHSSESRKEQPRMEETNSNLIDKQIESTNNIKPRSNPMVLTTDEKLPPEEVFANKQVNDNLHDLSRPKENPTENVETVPAVERIERKTNPLKNYRHQRPVSRPPTESSLSQLEKTASVLNKEGMPDFRRNLDDITQSYSPSGEEKVNPKSRKKKSPSRADGGELPLNDRQSAISSMPHSVSSLLGSGVGKQKPRKEAPNTLSVAPVESAQPFRGNRGPPGPYEDVSGAQAPMAHSSVSPAAPLPPPHGYPPNAPMDGSFPQYPGYGMGYGAYPNPAYYGGYGGAPPYYPPYGGPGVGVPPNTPPTVPARPPDSYMPPSPQW